MDSFKIFLTDYLKKIESKPEKKGSFMIEIRTTQKRINVKYFYYRRRFTIRISDYGSTKKSKIYNSVSQVVNKVIALVKNVDYFNVRHFENGDYLFISNKPETIYTYGTNKPDEIKNDDKLSTFFNRLGTDHLQFFGHSKKKFTLKILKKDLKLLKLLKI